MNKKNYQVFLLLIFILFTNCKQGKKKNLPKAMSQAEILEYFPKSEPLELSSYEESMVKDGLLDLQNIDETILVDLKYSSTDNFTGRDIYGNLELAYLQQVPAMALIKAHELLKEKNPNLRLLVYDAARPASVQDLLWNSLDSLPEIERQKYVASPEIASIHNYGCAVDLTIYDLERHRVLDMGTPYDFFGELAYPKLERQMINEGKLSLQQLNNRILLRNVMESVGFTSIKTEWWHFNFYTRSVAKDKYKIIP